MERELTMEGVRRISCRPRPPRITVLPVSMMTTLESRKPMLLIAHEREPRGWADSDRVRVSLARTHTHTQASTNNQRLGAERRIYFGLLNAFTQKEWKS